MACFRDNICKVLIDQTQVEQILICETGEAFLDNRSDDVVQVQFLDSVPFVEAGSHARSIRKKLSSEVLPFFFVTIESG